MKAGGVSGAADDDENSYSEQQPSFKIDSSIDDIDPYVAEASRENDEAREALLKEASRDAKAKRRDPKPVQRTTMSVEDMGKYLGISRTSAYAAVRCGDVPARRVGHRWIVSIDDVQRRFGINAESSDPWEPKSPEKPR